MPSEGVVKLEEGTVSGIGYTEEYLRSEGSRPIDRLGIISSWIPLTTRPSTSALALGAGRGLTRPDPCATCAIRPGPTRTQGDSTAVVVEGA